MWPAGWATTGYGGVAPIPLAETVRARLEQNISVIA
jgi:2-dehydro-3-deoxygluconokinase